MVRVPVLTPRLSSLLGRPGHAGAERRWPEPLVESVKHTSVVAEHDIAQYVPDPPEGLIGFDRARRARADQDPGPAGADPLVVGQHARGRRATRCPPTRTGRAATSTPTRAPGRSTRRPRRCGGSSRRSAATTAGTRSGWPGGCAGWIDRFSGGPGLRRGRRNPRDLVVGDALDWWRVEEIDEGRFLRLRAEMRLPGLAWLELEVGSGEGGTTTFRQRALFHPRGRPRARVLVVGLPVPRDRVRRHAAQHRPGRGAARRRPATPT